MTKQNTTTFADDEKIDKGDALSIVPNSPPIGWQIKRISDYLDENKLIVQNGFAYGGFNQDGRGIPHLRPFNVTENGLVDLSQIKYVDDLDENSMYFLQKGDIIFNNTNSENLVGKTAYFDRSGKHVLSNHMTFIRILDKKCIDAFWLAMKLQHLWRLGVFKALCRRHVGQASISVERLGSVKIAFPPLPEQRAIAHILQTVQNAIQARRNELALERERKAALMQHLFTHGTRGEATKQTEIGEMPKSWEVVQLEKLLREPLKNGYSAKVSDTNEGVRTLTLTAVTQNKFSVENTKLTVADPGKIQDLWLKPGDIFIERANTFEFVGLTALYDGPENFATYPDLLIRVRLKEDIAHPRFIAEFLLTTVCRSYFRRNARGTAGNMPKIDHGIVRRTPVPLPALTEQQQIAAILQACDSKIAALEKEIALQEELFRALLEELMSGRLSALPLVEAEGGAREALS